MAVSHCVALTPRDTHVPPSSAAALLSRVGGVDPAGCSHHSCYTAPRISECCSSSGGLLPPPSPSPVSQADGQEGKGPRWMGRNARLQFTPPLLAQWQLAFLGKPSCVPPIFFTLCLGITDIPRITSELCGLL